MVNDIKILLYTQAGTEYDISYITEIPMSLNLLIADVRQPDKRNSTFSKTINLPSTNEINKFFELIWRTNINLQTFNPNLKCKVYYYINGIEQIRGDLQLLRINVDDVTNEVIYECSIVGRLGNLFLAFGDKLLTDLDFSEFNHTLTKANIVDSWATQIQVSGSPVAFSLGYGYTYPLIDYGLNGGDVSNYYVKDMRPAIYKKTIMDKIFSLVGYTYNSNYLTSNYYKKLLIPNTSEQLFLTNSTIVNNQFYAGRTLSTYVNKPVTSVSFNHGSIVFSDVLIFNDDTTAPFNDAGNIYNNGTGELVITNSNSYNITAIANIQIKDNPPPTTATYLVTNDLIYIELQKFISGIWTSIGNNSFSGGGGLIPTGTVYSLQIPVSFTNYNLVAGDKLRVVVKDNQYIPISVDFYDSVGTIINPTGYGISIKYQTSTYYANFSNNTIIEGATIDMNKILPINTKIVDWFMNEVYLGNLYMEESKTVDKQIVIEDRDNFYTGKLDWTNKRDLSQKRIVTPMGDLDWKRYDFEYKQDTDCYNALYFDEYKETYGRGFYEIQNDFIKSNQKKELIYSPTPIVGNNVNGLVIPKIYKIDGVNIKPMKANIRHLYYGGITSLSFGNWTLKSSLSGDTVYTTYPFGGDCDNPYNPTVSINWDTPKKIYYNYQLVTYTNNNLKNRYYDRFVKQITDKNSKIELRHYVLNAYDIKQFSFRKIIFDTDAYFIVNAIKDYDVLKGDTQSTPVELLKLTDYDAFVPSIFLTPPPSGISSTARLIGGNYSNGVNNTNYGSNSHIVGGSGNFIASGARNIQLTNSTNVVVNSDVVNFIADGLSNVTIDSTYSNSTRIGTPLYVGGVRVGNIPVYSSDPISPAIGDVWFVQTKKNELQAMIGGVPLTGADITNTMELKTKTDTNEIFKVSLIKQ